LKESGKLVDLLSRINGGAIEIPDLDARSKNRDRRIDKVCMAVALIKARFEQDIDRLPRALLQFIAHTTFRYGVRSIAHLIDIIDSKAIVAGTLNLTKARLPMESEQKLYKSSLRLHLVDKHHGFGSVNEWLSFSKNDTMIPLSPDIYSAAE
jgi:hypothetical protein